MFVSALYWFCIPYAAIWLYMWTYFKFVLLYIARIKFYVHICMLLNTKYRTKLSYHHHHHHTSICTYVLQKKNHETKISASSKCRCRTNEKKNPFLDKKINIQNTWHVELMVSLRITNRLYSENTTNSMPGKWVPIFGMVWVVWKRMYGNNQKPCLQYTTGFSRIIC